MFEKMYKVRVDSKEKIADVIIRFLTCPYIHNPEVSIMNVKAKDFVPGYVFPRDMYAAVYRNGKVPTAEELLKVLKENDYNFAAIASFDKNDKQRMSLSAMEFDVIRSLIFNSITCTDKDVIYKVLDYLEGK